MIVGQYSKQTTTTAYLLTSVHIQYMLFYA